KKDVERKIEAAVKQASELNSYLERSAETMLNAMDRFSHGDLTVRLNSGSSDIMGKLFEGFNNTAENFSSLVYTVVNAVDKTAAAGEMIFRSTDKMASDVNEQMRQVSEISYAAENMTQAIQKNAKSAESASNNAREAGGKALQGEKAVKDTIGGMNRISDVVINSAQQVTELGNSSKQIGNIIQVIDDIADQTNLLALNAAIEAARAGEQGRGFAVVADEVRKLAEKTTKATKEIDAMIRRIQQDTDTAVKLIQNGTQEAETGKNLAARANKSLEEIIVGTENVTAIISDVALENEKQAASSGEIIKSIEEISAISHRTSDGIRQIVDASGELEELTRKLQSLVRKFQI
ncbi:MAG: methyl-accepting chemotaxis protein, partial [Syntrophothermus sp.]